MSRKRKVQAGKGRKAKAKEDDPSAEEGFGWNPQCGGMLKGTRFAKPPCPIGTDGHHQYTRDGGRETKLCRVWRCRLCARTLSVNRKTGNVREKRSAACAPA